MSLYSYSIKKSSTEMLWKNEHILGILGLSMLRDIKEFSLPALEEKVLSFWRAHNIFEASLAQDRKSVV